MKNRFARPRARPIVGHAACIALVFSRPRCPSWVMLGLVFVCIGALLVEPESPPTLSVTRRQWRAVLLMDSIDHTYALSCESASRLTRKDTWWSYKLCLLEGISQYHEDLFQKPDGRLFSKITVSLDCKIGRVVIDRKKKPTGLNASLHCGFPCQFWYDLVASRRRSAGDEIPRSSRRAALVRSASNRAQLS